MAATIKDVARRAKVSVATVSRLVNGTGNVGPTSAARITRAIEELGFRPNVVGRSLKMATHPLARRGYPIHLQSGLSPKPWPASATRRGRRTTI